jgi:hypothetical protein
MRHLIGIGLALVLSAAIFFGGDWAFGGLLARDFKSGLSPAVGSNFARDSAVTTGLAVMAAVALLIALALLVRWVSPLATGLPGLVLLAWTGLYVASPHRAMDYIPLKAYNTGLGFAWLGSTGILGAAGIALVVPLFFPSRWRRPDGAASRADDDAIEATAVTSPSSTALIAGLGSRTCESVTSENPTPGEADW